MFIEIRSYLSKASIRYNKEYYSNNVTKPNEELFFTLTLIPLGSTESDNVLLID